MKNDESTSENSQGLRLGEGCTLKLWIMSFFLRLPIIVKSGHFTALSYFN